MSKSKKLKIFEIDPYLEPFEKDLELRVKLYQEKRKSLLKDCKKIKSFA